ncbi:MAG: peptidase, partial [Gammaproteobacteria bacterium]|nr:peptidase [Gammaproteobacteria bacterium]
VDLARGAKILVVDGVDVVNEVDPDTINAGLFPDNAGEVHSFTVRDLDGTERSFSMTSAVITSTPVQNVKTINTGSGKAGYLLFNDHIATAEGKLFDAIIQLDAEGITDLILDIRYNGGGFLDISSQLAYMIAGAGRTSGEIFEAIMFNDKHPEFNPITGSRLEPVPFYSRSQGFDPDLDQGTLLPSLDLGKVYVLTGSGTCSASESIINGLRGVGVEVIQVGSTTCGKPYGFFPASNCGTTYFTIQFQGVNAKGFGDYPDGFSPANTIEDIGVTIPGCSVEDDFSADLGDPAEGRLAVALNHIDTGTCPAPAGLFGPKLLNSSSIFTDNVLIQKSLWQHNRILKAIL